MHYGAYQLRIALCCILTLFSFRETTKLTEHCDVGSNEASLNEVSSNLNYPSMGKSNLTTFYPIPKNTLGNLPIRDFFALNTTGQLTVTKMRWLRQVWVERLQNCAPSFIMSIFDKMKNKISNKTKQRSGTMSRPDSSEPFLERQEK